jgi:hypothetical protein
MTGLPPSATNSAPWISPSASRPTSRAGQVTWNQVDDDKMDALTPLFHLQRVAAFPALDDPERNLILYRLDPPTPGEPLPRRHRKPVTPRLLQTSFGERPSPTQLVH